MSLSRVVLAPLERKELERRARSRALAVELVKRAKVILMLAAGRPYSELVSGSLALIVTSVFGRSALSKSDWSVWIRVPRRRAPTAHASDRSAHFGIDSARTDQRIDPLEQLSACEGTGYQSVDVSRVWRQFGL